MLICMYFIIIKWYVSCVIFITWHNDNIPICGSSSSTIAHPPMARYQLAPSGVWLTPWQSRWKYDDKRERHTHCLKRYTRKIPLAGWYRFTEFYIKKEVGRGESKYINKEKAFSFIRYLKRNLFNWLRMKYVYDLHYFSSCHNSLCLMYTKKKCNLCTFIYNSKFYSPVCRLISCY